MLKMIGKIETPTTRNTGVSVEKNKKRKKKHSKEPPKQTKEDVISFGENAAVPSKQHVSTPTSTINNFLIYGYYFHPYYVNVYQRA